MLAFRNPVDIANRGLQKVGAARIDVTEGFNEDSKEASETSFVYDKLRVAELRARTWKFATRTAYLRPIDANTRILQPSLWASTTTYLIGAIVTDVQGTAWVSVIPSNLNNAPGNSNAWECYFGPMTVHLYDEDISYKTGEMVYKTPGDGTWKVYMSVADDNEDDPATATTYSATVTYVKDQIVTSAGTPYISLKDFNLGNTPASSPTLWSTTIPTGAGTGSMKWVQVGAALAPVVRVTPPRDSNSYVYRLPANYLRLCNQDPKAGATTRPYGASPNAAYRDWLFEGQYLLTMDSGPLMFRFVGDVTHVPDMDPMFCEGLACRIAFEVCEPLTQSNPKKSGVASEYQKFMSEARQANAIELGPEETSEDDFLAVRR